MSGKDEFWLRVGWHQPAVLVVRIIASILWVVGVHRWHRLAGCLRLWYLCHHYSGDGAGCVHPRASGGPRLG